MRAALCLPGIVGSGMVVSQESSLDLKLSTETPLMSLRQASTSWFCACHLKLSIKMCLPKCEIVCIFDNPPLVYGCKVVVLTKYAVKLWVGGGSFITIRVQFYTWFLLLLFYCFATKNLRGFLQNVPAKSGFSQMCLEAKLTASADCGGLPLGPWGPGWTAWLLSPVEMTL